MQGTRVVLEPFGKYVLLDRIGLGGMAEIFRARPTDPNSDGRIVVVKKLLPEITSDPTFLRMFRSEIAISMSLNHPNIVQIHDFGAIGGHPYLAMEYVQGQTLQTIANDLKKQGYVAPIEMTAFVIEKTARGLHYAHGFQNQATGKKLNLIHRDLSPENILISYDGQVKIIDFGIAKAALQVCEVTHPGLIKGKARYLSPEQVDGTRLDARSDVFQLGIVLWEMLTGYKLFAGKDASNEADSMRLIQTFKTVRKPSEYNPHVPPMLDMIVLKALQRKPEDRFQTAGDVERALHGFLSSFKPGYGALEVSETLKDFYQTEIIADATRMREMNEHSQSFLMSNVTRTLKTRTEKKKVGKPVAVAGGEPTWPERPSVERARVSRRFKRELWAWVAGLSTAFIGVMLLPSLLSTPHEPTYVRQTQLIRPGVPQSRSILLKIKVFPEAKPGALIQVNGRRVDPRQPLVRVPLDQPLRVQVMQRGSEPFSGDLLLKSLNVGHSKEYAYNVVLKPRVSAHDRSRKHSTKSVQKTGPSR